MVICLRGNFSCQAIEIELDITRTRACLATANDKDGKIAVVAPLPTEGDMNVSSSWQQGNNYLCTPSTVGGVDVRGIDLL